jgi:hypothetical protein
VAGPSVEFANGRWFTGAGFTPGDRFVVNGVFQASRPPRLDTIIDLGGRFVIPPFGDAHTHNLDGPFNLPQVRDAYIAEGTFYVQVLTNTQTGAALVRGAFNRPCALDVAYANGGITSTLSHPFLSYEPRGGMGLYDWHTWAARAADIRASRVLEHNAYWFVDSVAALDTMWPSFLDGHPDLVKVYLLDSQEVPPPVPDTGLPTGHGLRPSVSRLSFGAPMPPACAWPPTLKRPTTPRSRSTPAWTCWPTTPATSSPSATGSTATS